MKWTENLLLLACYTFTFTLRECESAMKRMPGYLMCLFGTSTWGIRPEEMSQSLMGTRSAWTELCVQEMRADNWTPLPLEISYRCLFCMIDKHEANFLNGERGGEERQRQTETDRERQRDRDRDRETARDRQTDREPDNIVVSHNILMTIRGKFQQNQHQQDHKSTKPRSSSLISRFRVFFVCPIASLISLSRALASLCAGDSKQLIYLRKTSCE